MKNTMKKLCSLFLSLALLLTFPVTAQAAGTFNAGVSITSEGNTITVTVPEENNDFLAAQAPRLSIPCGFAAATVTLNGETVESKLENGMVSFLVRTGGSYVITGSSTPAPCTHPDKNGDGICDNCGCNLGAQFKYASVALSGAVEMKCAFALTDNVLQDQNAYLQITRLDGDVETIPVNKAVPNGDFYVFSTDFAAKEMTDNVTICVVMGDGSLSQTYQYNLRGYADSVLSLTDPQYVKAVSLVKAMLLYGSYAQKHFDYRENALADAGLDMSEFNLGAVTADTLKSYANSRRQGTDKVVFVGSSLLLKSETILRLFFQMDSSILNNVTVTFNGQKQTLKANGSYYCVDITDIAAKNLCDDVKVIVNDGTNEATVTYNPMTYCYNVLARPGSYSESLVEVVKALHIYNQTAKAYFGS